VLIAVGGEPATMDGGEPQESVMRGPFSINVMRITGCGATDVGRGGRASRRGASRRIFTGTPGASSIASRNLERPGVTLDLGQEQAASQDGERGEGDAAFRFCGI
jgi:hypothetical protein